MGYNIAFPVVAATTAIIVLICLLSSDTNGSGGNVLIPPAAVPNIIIEGLGDVCYFDDEDCLSTLDPSPFTRSAIESRILSLDNEMVYLERDPIDPNIKRLYRFQGGCGFQHVRNDIDKYITMWPHLEGGEGITIADICDPGQPIIISVNTSELNITTPPSNTIVPSCGIVPTFLNDTTSLAVLLIGDNGVAVNDSCSPGDPIVIAFDPTAVNISEVVNAWFGAQCGVSITENAGAIDITLELQGLNGIVVSDACPINTTVNITFDPATVDAIAVYEEWFVDGCGITHFFSGGDINLAINATGTNGIAVNPLCGAGDALGLTFDPSAVNMIEAGDVWFIESCGTTVDTSSGQVAIGTLLEGGHGITVNASCAPGNPIIISWDASEVNLTDLVDMVFNGTCGVSIPQDNNTLAITLHFEGVNGIVVDDVCAMGEPIVLNWDPFLVNATELMIALFGDSCGFMFTESGGTIAGNVLLNGVNGIEVVDVCAPGGAIDLAWNESAVNLTSVVDNWYGSQCGITINENAGLIDVATNLVGDGGIMVDNTCASGEVIVSFNASQVNGSAAYEAWFVDGCGIAHSSIAETTTISTNIAVISPLYIDGPCGPGDALVIALNASELNITSDIEFGKTCGVSIVDNMGITNVTIMLNGLNGIVVDDSCPTDVIDLSWSPGNVNVTEVLSEWFSAGCGISLMETAGDITIAANIVSGNGIGITTGCMAGDSLELYFNPNALNISEFVDVVFGAQCGISAVVNAGMIDLKAELNGTNGITIDESCSGPDVTVSWNPANVNVGAVLAEWFIAGCGISLLESANNIVVAANIIGGGGIGVTTGCMAGDTLELYFNPNTLNVTEFADVVFGAQCGISAIVNTGVIDLKVELNGTNGITIDESCSGSDVIISWNPVNVDAGVVLAEWFIAGCGISLAESAGDIVIAANITGGNGIGITMGCMAGDALELYFDPIAMNVSEFVDVVFGAQCGISVIENAGAIDLKTELNGTNGITIDETCSGSDVIVSWNPANVDVGVVLTEWFIAGCGITLVESAGDIVIAVNITGGDGIGITAGCMDGDSLELYFNPNTMNVTEFTDVIFGAQCGISVVENAGAIDLKTELNGTNGITIDDSCIGPDVIVGFDPLLTDTVGINDAWFRDTCGVSRSIMGGDIGFDLGIVGDGIITIDKTCPGTETDIVIGINISALNIPDLGDACLIYGNASLTPAAALVRPEGFLFHRIIAEDACENRRTHFYIDLPHAPLGFGMLIGVNNVFTGAGVRSSAILGGENNAVAGGSQFTTTLNGQNHVVDITGDYGLIGGGDGHTLNGAMNMALMGTNHVLHAGSSHSTVVNGINNVVGPFIGPATRQFITINNGLNHIVKSAFSSIHNGVGNLIEDGAAPISGGVVLSGSASIVRGSYSVVLGATSSTNNGRTSLIGVGDLHFVSNSAVYGVIVGGERHVVHAQSGGILVGFSCTVSAGGTNSWVGGGRFNNVLGIDGFVLGGNTNVNNAARSGIGAGRNHNIGVLATDSFILAGDGVNLALATDAFTAASQHLLAVGALRTSGISTSNSPNWNLSFGAYFYLNFRSGAVIRLPTIMPEGTKFVIRNNSAGNATPNCAFNGCTICPQGIACTLNGNIVMTTQTTVSFIFIGNNYYVL